MSHSVTIQCLFQYAACVSNEQQKTTEARDETPSAVSKPSVLAVNPGIHGMDRIFLYEHAHVLNSFTGAHWETAMTTSEEESFKNKISFSDTWQRPPSAGRSFIRI